MATFPPLLTVNGYRASCLCDPQSPGCLRSPLFSPSFSLQLNMWRRNFGISVDNVYDVRLGRDWFSYCTPTVPHAKYPSRNVFIVPAVGCAPSSYRWVPGHTFLTSVIQFDNVHGQEMSDVSGPLLTCGADVVGSDATLNNNIMHVDVTSENIYSFRHPSSPASLLSSFLSMIEYATGHVLIDIARHHNM